MTRDTIINQVGRFISQRGGNRPDFYVGITGAVVGRLRAHNATDDYMHCLADSAEIAREVERACLAAGCQGGPGGGDDTATTVYVYKITSRTREDG